jgi:hypothetical protein
LNNLIKYADPSGHWVETAFDIAFIGYVIYDIATNGLNWENGLYLAADVAGSILPVVTGGGLRVRAAMHVDDAVKAGKTFDKVVDTAEVVNKIVDTTKTVDEVDKINDLAVDTKQSREIADAMSKG